MLLKKKIKISKYYLSDPKGSALYNYIKNGELKSEGGSITEGIGSSRVTKTLKMPKLMTLIQLMTMKHYLFFMI